MKRNPVSSWTPTNLYRVRNLRTNMTESEKKLWQRLRRDSLGVRFRRQVPIGPYILDFFCPSKKLAVEVDGELHNASRDANRDQFLLELGIETIRIPSWELFPPDDRTDYWVLQVWERLGCPESPP